MELSVSDEKETLTDEAKASVRNSGALVNLKDVSYNVAQHSHDDSMEHLRQEAQSTIQAIKQLLDGLNPDIGVSQKLKTALLDLQATMANGNISRAALETALAEATTAISGADSNGQSATAQQIEAQLWQRVEADNKDIDDDFEKMRKAGIFFGDKLWNRHKELTEYMLIHPRDITKQKELDAVDDALLLQADGQLDQHPEAKAAHDDARKKSGDRHKAVDQDLAALTERASLFSSAFDDDKTTSKPSSAHLTLNDVAPQSIGQKQNPGGEKLVMHMIAAFAEYERDRIAERTRIALQIAKARGVQLGTYGRNVLSKRNRELSRRFALAMQPMIARLVDDGFITVRAITDELNRMRVPTFRHKRCKWHLSTVHKVLTQINQKL